MKRGTPIPPDLQSQIRERWNAGESVVSIARALCVARNTVMRYASPNYRLAKQV